MSERFSNKVLKQAYEAFDDAYNEVYWGTPTPTVEVVAAAHAAGFAAMRAVLEGYLAAHLKHIILSIEPTSLADTYSEDDDIISRTDVMEALGLLPKASDGLRHDSIKPTSGRLLSAKKVKKEQP